MLLLSIISFFFFFNDTATTEIYTLSLHDALPILGELPLHVSGRTGADLEHRVRLEKRQSSRHGGRSEEHTSELQSRLHLVCRLLLEKKKTRYDAPPQQPSQHNNPRGTAVHLRDVI